MAATIFGKAAYSAYASDSHANLIERLWDPVLWKLSLGQNPLANYMGPGDNNIIQVDKNFLKAKGDKLTFGLRGWLSGDGQGDDGTYAGNEEGMVFHDMDVEIHERGHSVLLNGKMTEKRTRIRLRSQARSSLSEWLGRIQAMDITSALSALKTKKLSALATGADAQDAGSKAIDTVTRNRTAITSARRAFYGGVSGTTLTARASDSAVLATDRMGIQVISHLKRKAKQAVDVTDGTTGTVLSPMRPILVNGKPFFLLLLHQLQVKDLRNEAAWQQAQREANVRGNENPIFSGADAIYDGVIIKQCDYIHTRRGLAAQSGNSEHFDNTGDICASGVYVARGLFLGAQAACLAQGQLPSWMENYSDWAKTKFGVHTDTIYGVKKSIFNSVEFGCITVDTSFAPDS